QPAFVSRPRAEKERQNRHARPPRQTGVRFPPQSRKGTPEPPRQTTPANRRSFPAPEPKRNARTATPDHPGKPAFVSRPRAEKERRFVPGGGAGGAAGRRAGGAGGASGASGAAGPAGGRAGNDRRGKAGGFPAERALPGAGERRSRTEGPRRR